MSVRTLSIVLAVLTFGLIIWGSHVNTTRSGMAFPDWPTSNTNPMLTYAPSQWLWQGDKFWEHGHRLFASLVGITMVVLTVVAWRGTPKSERPNGVIAGFLLLVLGTVASAVVGLQTMPTGFMESFMIAMGLTLCVFLYASFNSGGSRRILWLCLAGFAGVCLQGAFGGYTVRHQLPAWTSTTHGMLAELFFTIVLAIVWLSGKGQTKHQDIKSSPNVKYVVVGLWALLAVQFLLGALTRHTESWGVSTTWPMWDSNSFLPAPDLWQYPQVLIHFVHRTMAYAVAIGIGIQLPVLWNTAYRRNAIAQTILVVAQIALGVGIITTAREEITTTLHVMGGVLLLAISARMSFAYLPWKAESSAVPSRSYVRASL